MQSRFNRTQPQKSPSIFPKLIFTVFLLTILVFGGVFWYYKSTIVSPIAEGDKMMYFKVENGDNRNTVAERLDTLDMLDNPEIFVWYARISGKGGDIKAGNHVIKASMNMVELMNELESEPDDTTVWITIPEGIRYDEVADALQKGFAQNPDSKFDKDKFLDLAKNPDTISDPKAKEFLDKHLPEGKSIEGFLYPDTYNFAIDATEQQVIAKLILTLKSKIDSAEIATKLQASDLELYEVLTIASMIEREAFTEEESYMISDIIQSRLEIGMVLGIDATSLYPLKDWKAPLTYKELQDPNPYNTRLNAGLPPTPIANPGIVTIKATLNPKSNDYFYYLHDNTGQIHYGKTNQDHVANINKYLR